MPAQIQKTIPEKARPASAATQPHGARNSSLPGDRHGAVWLMQLGAGLLAVALLLPALTGLRRPGSSVPAIPDATITAELFFWGAVSEIRTLTAVAQAGKDSASFITIDDAGFSLVTTEAAPGLRLELQAPLNEGPIDLAAHPLDLTLLDEAGAPYQTFTSAAGSAERIAGGLRFSASMVAEDGSELLASGRLEEPQRAAP